MNTEYERGYREGAEHISKQVDYLNSQVLRVTELLSKAVFVRAAKDHPKPNMHIWLVLEEDMITTGYFTGGSYVADSGYVVTPRFWCMIPSVITGEPNGIRRRIVKRD